MKDCCWTTKPVFIFITEVRTKCWTGAVVRAASHPWKQTLMLSGCTSCSLPCLWLWLGNCGGEFYTLWCSHQPKSNLWFHLKPQFMPDCHQWMKLMTVTITCVQTTAGDIIMAEKEKKKSILRWDAGRADGVPARLNMNHLNNGITIVRLCCGQILSDS